METNTTIMEMEETILKASINNWVINATNITGVSEDIWYLIQSDMENQIFQVQRMLADKLDAYKGRGNAYVDDNIWEIQDLFKEKESKKEERQVENKEVILVQPYEVSRSSSSTTSTTSFIMEEVKNLIKYMKFVWSPTQTQLFRPLSHYQSLESRGEQDPEFWKEVTTAPVDQKYNTETARNSYQIIMFQGGLPHEPYFISIDNRGQVIIGPNKKTVATYVVEELEVLIWFMETWMLKRGYCYDWCLLNIAWIWVKDNDNMIICTAYSSVSISCRRCNVLTLSSCIMTCFTSCTPNVFFMDYQYIVRCGLHLSVKIVEGGLCSFLFSLFYFYFYFFYIFSISIFRTTQVRGYQSCCHISHNLMA